MAEVVDTKPADIPNFKTENDMRQSEYFEAPIKDIVIKSEPKQIPPRQEETPATENLQNKNGQTPDMPYLDIS